MKRILITGAHSYIGTSFESYLKQWPEQYQIDTIDMRGEDWREKSFAGYDTVLHMAGIVHIKEVKSNQLLYEKINCDLAIETAKKSKDYGVKQFIFLSTMGVYGMDTGVITKETIPQPVSYYAKSKLKAEKGIQEFADGSFCVAILRPPIVYGKGCKGNFWSMVRFVQKLPVFPYTQNIRSMIYIENLCVFLKLATDHELNGCFFPQNRDYVQIKEMAQEIAKFNGKKIHFSRVVSLGIFVLKLFLPSARKAFGSLIYKNTEDFGYCYCLVDFQESMKASMS